MDGSGSKSNSAGKNTGAGAGAAHRSMHEKLLRESTVDPSVLIGEKSRCPVSLQCVRLMTKRALCQCMISRQP